jgi:hypothetical protein
MRCIRAIREADVPPIDDGGRGGLGTKKGVSNSGGAVGAEAEGIVADVDGVGDAPRVLPARDPPQEAREEAQDAEREPPRVRAIL